jgi:uncharacterized protein YceK
MNKRSVIYLILVVTICLGGCAHLAFYDSPREGALTYYEGKPYLFVSVDKNCVSTATIIMLPAKAKSVAFKSGYGSNELSVSMPNGMITSVNQKTDTQIPETITAIGSMASKVAAFAKNGQESLPKDCPASYLYPIENGVPGKEPLQLTTGRLSADWRKDSKNR